MDYQAFRAQYEQQHPASIPQPEPEVQQYAPWVKRAVLAMFVCAALLSAVHTVPTVYLGIDPVMVDGRVRAVAAALSFVFVELMILLSAYLYLKDRGWAILVGGFTFLVAAIANVQSALHSFNADNVWTTFVSVLIGLLAPVVCLAAGKLYVNIQHAAAAAMLRTRRAYQDRCEAWDAEILAAFEKQQKRTVRSASKTSARRPVDTPTDTSAGDESGHGTGQGYNKRTDARDIIAQHIETHPQDADIGVRKLADKLGVGKSTVADVLRELRTEKISANGHGDRSEL